MSDAFLLVTAGGARVGLPVAQLEGVADAGDIVPIPAAEPALIGVTTVRGETLPVISLARLLGSGASEGETVTFVLVNAGGMRICLAVDGAEMLSRGVPMPLPPDGAMPWARAVLRDGNAFVPLLDLEALAERLAATGRAS